MKRLFSIVAILSFSISLFAQEVYEKGLFVSSATGDSLQYRYLTPENSKAGKKYPLVIFLHGSGERGNDNEKQLTHGGQMFLNPVYREKYPAYVIFPQCPAGVSGAFAKPLETLQPERMPMDPALSNTLKTLKELIDSYIAMPEIDDRRVYAIGLSMGGMATFELAVRYPETFAAVIPICGSVNPARLKAAKDVSFRIFHGDADAAVTTRGSREAYKALRALKADVEYIEFAGCTHGSWNPAFNYPNFMKWLFSKKK